MHVEKIKKPSIYLPAFQKVVVKSLNGMVYLNIDGKIIELTTVKAHKVGFMLCQNLNPDESYRLVINREKFEILQSDALKIGAALLRKADAADDWQISHRIKL